MNRNKFYFVKNDINNLIKTVSILKFIICPIKIKIQYILIKYLQYDNLFYFLTYFVKKKYLK